MVNRIYDTLQIDYINPVPEDKPLKGGIKDLGDFFEGKCIALSTKIPFDMDTKFNPLKYSGRAQTWVLCTNKSKPKSTLLMTLLKMKVRRQRDQGEVLTKSAIDAKNKNKALALGKMIAKLIPRKGKKITKPTDGYWMLLQDWTECSLKCGGGISHQQWMCVPPKRGGKPCKGTSIKTRPCNNQKCPGVKTLLKLVNGSPSKVKKPIVKNGAFSARPNRFSKCLIKDNDAYLMTSQSMKTVGKIPVRVVMNNQTLTVFGDDSYSNVIYSFKLEYSSFGDNKFCCFNIRDSHKQLNLCGYESMCGNRITNNWAARWKKDFQLFKVDCHVGRQTALLSKEDEHSLDDDFNGKVNVAKEEMIKLKSELVKKKEKKLEQRTMRGKVLKTQKDGFTLIQKEIDLEKMVKKEEMEREGLELKNVMKVLKAEKKKKKCLKKSLKKREKQNKALMAKRDNDNEIQKLNKEVEIEVELKRKELKRQIALLRARARRKKAELQDQINRVRGQMAKDMMEANKNGNLKHCIKGKKEAIYRNNYCNTNFVDDYLKNNDCKVGATFCYTCCENEFGNAFLEKRDQCYNACDGKGKKKKPDSKKKKSDAKKPKKALHGWAWVKHIKPIKI